jgi:hypothetical protein
MPATLTIHDETSSGQKIQSFTLECLTERMTVRELLRARIDRGNASPKAGGKVFLPFEGDSTLSIILSKAFLLAEDCKINDPTILRQLTPD